MQQGQLEARAMGGRSISWFSVATADSLQGYQRAKLLSSDELSLLKSLSKLVRHNASCPLSTADLGSPYLSVRPSLHRQAANMPASTSISCASYNGSTLSSLSSSL